MSSVAPSLANCSTRVDIDTKAAKLRVAAPSFKHHVNLNFTIRTQRCKERSRASHSCQQVSQFSFHGTRDVRERFEDPNMVGVGPREYSANDR